MRFHLYKVQNQAKVTYAIELWEVVTGRSFWGAQKGRLVFYLGANSMGVFTVRKGIEFMIWTLFCEYLVFQ